jgi:tagatose 1,6-diphosphate aldolase
MTTFEYARGHRFKGEEIDVIIDTLAPARPDRQWVPAYICRIVLAGTNRRVGGISARLGYTEALVKYGGHIGYGVNPAHRGNRYAAKACRLVKPIFEAHGMDVIWITCNPDNWASRRTCERLGLELVDIVDLPEDNDMYKDGERQKCRYRWIIYPER